MVTQNGNNCGIQISMNFKSLRSHFWTTLLKLISQFRSEVQHICIVGFGIWANERYEQMKFNLQIQF